VPEKEEKKPRRTSSRGQGGRGGGGRNGSDGRTFGVGFWHLGSNAKNRGWGGKKIFELGKRMLHAGRNLQKIIQIGGKKKGRGVSQGSKECGKSLCLWEKERRKKKKGELGDLLGKKGKPGDPVSTVVRMGEGGDQTEYRAGNGKRRGPRPGLWFIAGTKE